MYGGAVGESGSAFVVKAEQNLYEFCICECFNVASSGFPDIHFYIAVR